MKTNLSIAIFCFLIILLFQSCKKKQDSISTNEPTVSFRTKIIDSIGQAYINDGKLMGLSIAIMQKGDTLYNKGFGYTDSLKTKPVTNKNIFLMASISKLIGSTIVMKLVEENVFELDNTLSELLPDFPNSEQAKKITLRHLISHTSGIQDYAVSIDSIYVNEGRVPTKQDFYNFFDSKKLMFEPGTYFNYSNSGFVLMSMIIEHATNTSYQEQIDRIINKPNNFNIKLISENITNPMLSSYFTLKDSILINRPHWTWIKGDGGLSTSAIELANFPFKWSEGHIITKASYQEMTTPTVFKNGIKSGYGLGVRTGELFGESVVGHTGGEKSTWAIMKYYTESELCIVVFVNTDDTPSNAIDIEGDLSLAIFGQKFPDLEQIEEIDHDLSQYIGEYSQLNRTAKERSPLIYFRKENDPHLYRKIKNTDSKGQKLFYLGNNKFAHKSYPTDRIIFDLDENGNAVSFREYYHGFFFRMGKKLNGLD